MNPKAIELVNALLKKLCRELGAPAAELDNEGEVGLEAQYQGQTISVTVSYREPENMIQMVAPIPTPLNEPARSRLAPGFLALNLSAKDTAGLAFGLSPADGQLVLTCSLIGLDHTYRTFRAAFFRLFAATAVWKTRIDEISKETDQA